MPEYPLVLVKWVDSCSVDEWCSPKALGPPMEMETAGFLVCDEKTHISVSSSHDETGKVSCTMTIPRIAVRSIHNLSVSRKPRRR